jgi:hypothetical protein
MSISVTPIPRLIDLAAPAFTLGTANTAGSAATAISSNSTILTFDATVPTTIAYGASAAAGSATVATRRDHTHGMAASDAIARASTSAIAAETDEATYISPNRAVYIPGVAKTYAVWDNAGTSLVGENVGSVDDNGTGSWQVNYTTNMGTTTYTVLGGTSTASTADALMTNAHAPAVDDVGIRTFNDAGTAADPENRNYCIVLGTF